MSVFRYSLYNEQVLSLVLHATLPTTSIPDLRHGSTRPHTGWQQLHRSLLHNPLPQP